MEAQGYKIEIYAPESHLEALMDAIAQAGAGRIGAYERCASVSEVMGYWMPLDGSAPYDGEPGKLTRASERKLEAFCRREDVRAVIAAIRKVHPYEEPVFYVIALSNGEV